MLHGRDESEWNEVVEVGYGILRKLAADKEKPISYTAFSGAVADGMDEDHRRFVFPQDRNAIGTLLAEISKLGLVDHPGWLLSALVTGQNSERPGGGFYDLAKSLGMLSEGAGRDEKEIFFGKQVEGLRKAYQRRRPGAESPAS